MIGKPESLEMSMNPILPSLGGFLGMVELAEVRLDVALRQQDGLDWLDSNSMRTKSTVREEIYCEGVQLY